MSRPSGRNCCGRKAIFQDKVPGDQPGDELAQCGIGIGIGRARYRDHRRQFGVAHGRKDTDDPGEHERQHNGRSCIDRGLLAGQHEDPAADHPTDTQQGQGGHAQRPAQRMLAVLRGLREQHLDRFLGE